MNQRYSAYIDLIILWKMAPPRKRVTGDKKKSKFKVEAVFFGCFGAIEHKFRKLVLSLSRERTSISLL